MNRQEIKLSDNFKGRIDTSDDVDFLEGEKACYLLAIDKGVVSCLGQRALYRERIKYINSRLEQILNY